MKKTRVLAALIGLVLIAVLFLVWLLASDRAAQVAIVPGDAERAGDHATELESRESLEPAHTEPRAEVPTTDGESALAPAPTKRPSLRIHVLYASGKGEQPAGLDVGVASPTGSILQTRHVGPNEFLLVEELPGSYVVAAKAPGFRTSVVRAQLSAHAPESTATITLTLERRVRVGWSSPDGRPIQESLADSVFEADGRCVLEARVTKFPRSDDRAERRHSLASLNCTFMLDRSPNGARDVDRYETGAIDPLDTLGYLKIDEDGPLWVSAWCNKEWIASEPLDPTAREVVFITPLPDLIRPGGSVKVRVVDDATSEPIEGADIHFDEERFTVETTDAKGEYERARLTAGLHTLTVAAPGRFEAHAEFTVRVGETTDVGTIRLEKGLLYAYFRVVDEKGAARSGARFELVELDGDSRVNRSHSSFAATSDVPRRAGDTNPKANLRFLGVNRVRYVLRCKSQMIDAAPRIVQPEELTTSGRTGVIAELVVRPASTARFVIDPPIAKGTQVVVESATGHPLRELEVDLFGVATTDILPGAYRVHVIEYARPTDAIDVRVDGHPFVFDIRR